MESPSSSPTNVSRTHGRYIVFGLVASALVAIGVAVALRLENRDRIREAQLKAMPTLAAMVAVSCVTPGGAAEELHRGGRCGSADELALSMSTPADGTRSVLYALLSADAALSGPLAVAQSVRMPVGASSGARTLVVVLSSEVLPAAALQEALDQAPERTIAGRVSATDAFVGRLIAAGGHARVERFDFSAEPAP